jgi:hypothetical protein
MGYDPRYDMTVYASAGMVRSASDGARAHRVQLPDCDCADFINRKGQLAEIDGMPVITICKHIAEFMNRAGGWKRPAEPGPVTYSDLTYQRARNVLTENGVTAGCTGELLAEASTGRPSFYPGFAGRHGEIKVEAAERRYTITVSPVRH